MIGCQLNVLAERLSAHVTLRASDFDDMLERCHQLTAVIKFLSRCVFAKRVQYICIEIK